MAKGAITVKIDGDYNDKDINRAIKDLGSLKTQSGAATPAMSMTSKAMLGLGAAAAGLASIAVVTDFLKDSMAAAIEDEKSMVSLAKAMDNLGLAHANSGVEAFIKKMMLATGVADDQLRPAYQKLVTATGDAEQSQKLLALAMDVSAGTGKDLGAVSLALTKASLGQLSALTRLGVPLDANIIKSKDFAAATDVLTSKFGGQAAAAAETYGGRIQRLTTAFGEAQESIGFSMLDAIDSVSSAFGDDDGLIANIDTAGQSVATFITGIGVVVTEMGKLKVAADNAPALGNILSFALENEKFINPLAMLRDTIFDLGTAAQSAEPATRSLGREFTKAADGASGMSRQSMLAAEATENLTESVKDFQNVISSAQALDDWKFDLHQLDKALKDNGMSFRGWSEGAKENRDTLTDSIAGISPIVQKMVDDGKIQASEFGVTWRGMRDDAVDAFVKYGFKRKQVMQFLGNRDMWTGPMLDNMAAVGNVGATALTNISAKLGPIAFREFKGVGFDMAAGLAQGITNNSDGVSAAARQVIAIAERASRERAESKSPSKVFERIGNDLMAGLEKGIDDDSSKVSKKAKKAIESAILAVQESLQSFKDYKDSIGGAMVGLLNLGDAYETFTQRQQAVTSTLAELMQYQAEIQGESTDDQKAKLAELQTAYQQAQGAAATGAQSIVDEFILQGQKIAEFNSNMQKLLNAGLSKTAFDAILAESSGRGADIAAALADGNIAENARRVSQVYTSVQRMGDETGQAAAATFMGTGVKLAIEMLGGLIKELMPSGSQRKALMSALKGLNDSIKFEPKFIDIITRRFDEGSAPAAVVAGGGVNAAGGGAGNFTNDELTQAMLGYTGPIFPPGFEFDFSGIGGLPRFADGGIATKPTLGIFGEAGPEALVPLSRGGNSMLGGNNTYNITINTGIGDPRVIGEEVVNVISKFEKANGAVFVRT